MKTFKTEFVATIILSILSTNSYAEHWNVNVSVNGIGTDFNFGRDQNDNQTNTISSTEPSKLETSNNKENEK